MYSFYTLLMMGAKNTRNMQSAITGIIKTNAPCCITLVVFINILGSIQFSENRADYEAMWKNVVVSDRAQMTIQYGEKICDVNVR